MRLLIRQASSANRAGPVLAVRDGVAMTDELANDRTFLAWLRTGSSVAGLGFVVARFALLLEQFGHPAAGDDGRGRRGIVIRGVLATISNSATP